VPGQRNQLTSRRLISWNFNRNCQQCNKNSCILYSYVFTLVNFYKGAVYLYNFKLLLVIVRENLNLVAVTHGRYSPIIIIIIIIIQQKQIDQG